MTDHLPNCYRNQTMGHYGGGPADCDCGAARRAMVKPASMTDAADKAHEIVVAWASDEQLHLNNKSGTALANAIAAVIESAVRAERTKCEADTDDYDALLLQINKTLEPMVKAWQESTNRPNTLPGYPNLVAFWQTTREQAVTALAAALEVSNELQAERERAGKLVDAAKALVLEEGQSLSFDNLMPLLDNLGRAVSAYEVQP